MTPEKKAKLAAAGARARALFSSREPVSNAAAPGWDDWDSRELDGEMAWEKEDDSGGLPSAGGGWADYNSGGSSAGGWTDDDECSSAEAVEDDAGLMMYEDWIQPPEGDWIQPPEGDSSDPKGGMGIPARLADMMSMLHVRLLSLEVGLRSRNLYRAGM